jgi:hypothetical protein
MEFFHKTFVVAAILLERGQIVMDAHPMRSSKLMGGLEPAVSCEQKSFLGDTRIIANQARNTKF